MNIVEYMPADWKVDVVVTPVSRDSHGVIQRGDPVSVAGCIPSWSASADPADLADFTQDVGYLYPSGNPSAFVNGAEVVIPANDHGPSGTWHISGQPQLWPLGFVVELNRG
jgi:hypothetical protein